VAGCGWTGQGHSILHQGTGDISVGSHVDNLFEEKVNVNRFIYTGHLKKQNKILDNV